MYADRVQLLLCNLTFKLAAWLDFKLKGTLVSCLETTGAALANAVKRKAEAEQREAKAREEKVKANEEAYKFYLKQSDKVYTACIKQLNF